MDGAVALATVILIFLFVVLVVPWDKVLGESDHEDAAERRSRLRMRREIERHDDW